MSILEQFGITAYSDNQPLDQAQELCYRAFDSESRVERRRLAKRALQISPDCADAYGILAEDCTHDPNEELQLWQRGVLAGERAIGRQCFKQDKGLFWGILETRPYMRAKQGLSQCLWDMSRKDEAIRHAQEMLELNPSDNQGVRFYLLAWLIEQNIEGEGSDQTIEQLLAQYCDEHHADWLYTYGLWLLHCGRKADASRIITKSMNSNSFVPSYLLGRRPLPTACFSLAGLGSEEEAANYVLFYGFLWSMIPGALGWLSSYIKLVDSLVNR